MLVAQYQTFRRNYLKNYWLEFDFDEDNTWKVDNDNDDDNDIFE